MDTRCIKCNRKFAPKVKFKDFQCYRHSSIHCHQSLEYMGEICDDCYHEACRMSAKRKQIHKGH